MKAKPTSKKPAVKKVTIKDLEKALGGNGINRKKAGAEDGVNKYYTESC